MPGGHTRLMGHLLKMPLAITPAAAPSAQSFGFRVLVADAPGPALPRRTLCPMTLQHLRPHAYGVNRLNTAAACHIRTYRRRCHGTAYPRDFHTLPMGNPACLAVGGPIAPHRYPRYSHNPPTHPASAWP